MWLATRMAFVLLTYFVVVLGSGAKATRFTPVSPHFLLDAWNHWDADWYIRIAHGSYFNAQATAFFPLYPLLIRLATLVIGTHWVLSALLVANLGTLGAFVGIGLLAANEDGSETAASRTIRVATAYPLALFLFAPYSEGLFLALVTAALFCARRGSWRWAALWAFVSGLTRPTGVVLMLPLLWEYGRQHGWWGSAWRRARGWRRQPGAPSWRALGGAMLLLAAVPLAVSLYAAYLWLHFGHPLLFLHVQRIYWARENQPIWFTIPATIQQHMATPAWTYWRARQWLDLGPVLIFGALTIAGLRHLPFAFTLYMLGLLYLTVAQPVVVNPGYPDMLMSAGRFLVAAAPAFLLVGQWIERRPWLDLLVVSGGFMLQAVFAASFLAYGWIL
jgi:hypothetical protein